MVVYPTTIQPQETDSLLNGTVFHHVTPPIIAADITAGLITRVMQRLEYCLPEALGDAHACIKKSEVAWEVRL